MASKDIQDEGRYVIGPGALRIVKTICKRIGLEGNALMIYDANTKTIAADDVAKRLSSGYSVYELQIEDSTMEYVQAARDEIRRKDISFVLGIGGGKSIDVAKLSSYKSGKPFVSVPTVASHDGIASARASIHSDKGKSSEQAHPPFAVVADTKIISEAPERYYRSGLGDLVSNVTAVADWYLASKMGKDTVNETSALMSMHAATELITHPETINDNRNLDHVRKMVWLLIDSGKAMQLARSSRPASGYEHKFSHALDEVLDVGFFCPFIR